MVAADFLRQRPDERHGQAQGVGDGDAVAGLAGDGGGIGVRRHAGQYLGLGEAPRRPRIPQFTCLCAASPHFINHSLAL